MRSPQLEEAEAESWDQKGKPIGSERDKTYFNYYGMLMHQQNMLLDSVRTFAYHNAVSLNPGDFMDKIVLDIGAGTGILSFFAAKAGAKRVYAVEASGMAIHAKRLVKANGMENVIKIIQGKVEEIDLPEKVDVIISEPMGVMLVHERMMESFIVGRDRFLKPTTTTGNHHQQLVVSPNQMYPSSGAIYLAPFSDMSLFADAINKISFWNNREFYGVDLTSLLESASTNQFAQAIVGPFDPKTLLASPVMHPFDFTTISVSEFQDFTIPFKFLAEATGIVHGIAGWFDVVFAGSQVSRHLSTSPLFETTHWYQVRYLFNQPIAVNRGQVLLGQMQIHANDQRSYDLQITIHLEGTEIIVRQKYSLQDQQYWNLGGAPLLPTGGGGGGAGREMLGIYADFFDQ